MTTQESALVVLFVMAVVFLVLISLSLIIRVFSKVLAPLANRAEERRAQTAAAITEAAEEDFSSGVLKLKNVDEPTAAMIMAIVSDESGIPLKELLFKSISFVGETDGRQES